VSINLDFAKVKEIVSMDVVKLRITTDGIATITINRPEVRNALNWAAMRAFHEAVARAHEHPDIQALIVTGSQGAFCAGGDLYELHDYMTHADGVRLGALMGEALSRLSALPCPSIAAVEGHAMGGGAEIALACDMRVLSQEAKLGLMHIRLAISPAWGGGQRLLQLVGYSRALEWLTAGRVLDAQEAFQVGLANRITPVGDALQTAVNLAEAIAGNDARAVRGIKAFLRLGAAQSMEKGSALEQKIFAELWAAAPHHQASQRFVSRKNHRQRERLPDDGKSNSRPPH
jgi:enoyl-CoA hydratase